MCGLAHLYNDPPATVESRVYTKQLRPPFISVESVFVCRDPLLFFSLFIYFFVTL